MEEKKKFEKPSMKVVELKSKVQILAGSECLEYCSGDCSTYSYSEG